MLCVWDEISSIGAIQNWHIKNRIVRAPASCPTMQTASFIAEKLVGHGTSATTADVSNPAQNAAQFADGDEKMLALTWQGKGKVEMGKFSLLIRLFSALTRSQSRRSNPRSSTRGMS